MKNEQTGRRFRPIKWILISAMVLMMTVLCKGINVQAETGTPIDGTITYEDLHIGDYIGSNTIITGFSDSSKVHIRYKLLSTCDYALSSTCDYQTILNDYNGIDDTAWDPQKNMPGSYYINNVNAFKIESKSDHSIWVHAVHLNLPEEQNTTSSSVPCEHDYQWLVENEPTEDITGLMVEKCTKCGNIRASQTIPAIKDDFGRSMYERTKQILCAKSGQTITVDIGNWDTLTKSFFEALANKRDITVTVKFMYEGRHYEFKISPGQTVDTSVDYYGPEKLIQLYGAKEVVTK